MSKEFYIVEWSDSLGHYFSSGVLDNWDEADRLACECVKSLNVNVGILVYGADDVTDTDGYRELSDKGRDNGAHEVIPYE